jgi:hypothetical protein
VVNFPNRFVARAASGCGCILAFGLVFAGSAHGAVITLDAIARGWHTASINNGASPGNNYFVGCNSPCDEVRNFFVFDIPLLSDPVVSAVLTLDSGGVSAAGDSYQITSIPAAFGFSDLGTGTVFGSRVYSPADALTRQSINLNAAGIAAITSGSPFRIGGHIEDLSGTSNTVIFSGTFSLGPGPFPCIQGGPCISQLQITTGTVPEPGTWALFAVGLVGLRLMRKAKTRKSCL